MKSITVHDLDKDLYSSIQSRASSKGISLNKTIKQLLRKSLGLTQKRADKRDFSKFVGVWSKKEADAIDKVLEDFEKIDEEDWK